MRGARAAAELDAAGNRSEAEVAELALLSLLEIEGRPVRADRLRKLPGGEAAAERLLRRAPARSARGRACTGTRACRRLSRGIAERRTIAGRPIR